MVLLTSPAARLAGLTEGERRMILAGMSPAEIAALEFTWPFWARPDQLPPEGDWRQWLLLGGRGCGKTRSAAEWVRSEIESGRRRHIGVVGSTANDIRSIMVEGPSGILAVCPPDSRPSYEPSTLRIVWPNGAMVHLYTAEKPQRLRGPNLDAVWCDELAAWDDPERAWDQMQLALRIPGPLGHSPQVVVTTTPKPIPLLRQLLAADDTVITRARTSDNAANLDRHTLAYYQKRYGGTTLGRQELDGEMLIDLEGALWTRQMFDTNRLEPDPPRVYARIVVAIDPAGSSKSTSDETGIIVAARDAGGRGYVLADCSGRYSPEGWARKAVLAYQEFKADRIVAESNFGGEMVEATIRSVANRVPVKLVNASRGKAVRAEPIVALYEQARVHHVGTFPQLEDQMTSWVPGVSRSPDRLDAAVWALTELLDQPYVAPVRWSSGSIHDLPNTLIRQI